MISNPLSAILSNPLSGILEFGSVFNGATAGFNFAGGTGLTPVIQGGPALSYSGASNKTMYRSDGWLVFAPNNQWLYSNDPTNAAWTVQEAFAVASSVPAPLGISGGSFRITSSANNAVHFAGQNYTGYIAGQTYTLSYYLQAGERQFAQLVFPGGPFNATSYANFDLINGTVTVQGSTATATISNAGSGWWRCSITSICLTTTSGVASTAAIVTGTDGRAPAFIGNPALGYYMAGAQLELGPYVQAYNPTTSAIYYGPRLDYNPTTTSYSNQNLALRSEEFDNVYWTKTNSGTSNPVVTANQTASPTGTLTADKVDFPAVSGVGNFSLVFHQFNYPTDLISPITTYTGSIWLRGDVGGEIVWIMQTPNGSNFTRTQCTLTTSWQRFEIASAPLGLTTYFQIGIDKRDTVGGQTSAVPQTIYVWGGQLNAGSTATTYTPTTSTAVIGSANAIARGLLIEGARTNLLTYSDDFNNAIWNKSDTVITSDNAVSPEGVQNADLFTEGSAGTAGVGVFGTAGPFTANSVLSFTFFIKRGNHDWIRARLFDSTNTDGANCYFNISSGTTGSIALSGLGSGYTTSIVSLPNGWFRCNISGLPNSTTTTATVQTMSATGDGNNIRIAGGTRYQYGAQLEVGLFPSSYIPTYAATATRASEFASVPTAGWFNQPQGTIYAVLTSTQTNNTTTIGGISIDGGSSITAFEIFPNRGLSTNTEVFNGNTSAVANLGSYVPNTKYKVAAAYATADFAASRNGAAVVTNNLGALPTGQTTLRLGVNDSSTLFLWGWIEQFAYWPTRRSNAELQSISA